MKSIKATTALLLFVITTFIAYRVWGADPCRKSCMDALNACTRSVNWNNGHQDENMEANNQCNRQYRACLQQCPQTH